jgi:hypothetical protein
MPKLKKIGKIQQQLQFRFLRISMNQHTFVKLVLSFRRLSSIVSNKPVRSGNRRFMDLSRMLDPAFVVDSCLRHRIPDPDLSHSGSRFRSETVGVIGLVFRIKRRENNAVAALEQRSGILDSGPRSGRRLSLNPYPGNKRGGVRYGYGYGSGSQDPDPQH